MHPEHFMRTNAIVWIPVLLFASVGYGADRPLTELEKTYGRGVPSSPFLGFAYRYADALTEKGRDTYGPQHTGLLLSALDRRTLAPLETRPPAPAGVREDSRPGPHGGPLVGANPQLDQNALRLLYVLRIFSQKELYTQTADNELAWFLNNTASAATGLLPWGKGMCWNVMTDAAVSGGQEAVHEFAGPWLLWDKCFELAPEASKRFALALWNNQIADHETGAFDRRARFDECAPRAGNDCPRHAGFYIRTWAEAYAHSQDPVFLKAIEVLLSRCEKNRHPTTGLIGTQSDGQVFPLSTLSLAIDSDGAARKVPEPLASRLAGFAAREDEAFCSLPHDLKGRKGFVMQLDRQTGTPAGVYTPLWDPKHEGTTTAMVAMMCVSRYENTGRVCYRKLIIDAADAYMNSLPEENVDAWPMTFGQAISLQLAAFRASARGQYHLRAFELARIALDKFWGDNPLPRASLKSEHYESTTGAATLALAFVEMHLSTLHIDLIRAPANTVDR